MYDIRWLQISAAEIGPEHSTGFYDEYTRTVRILQIRVEIDGKVSDWQAIPVVTQKPEN